MPRWYTLTGFSCPVSGCKGQQGSYSWVCTRCKTRMYISETGYLRCEERNHCSQIINWKFDCGNHGNHPAEKYKYADFQGFTFALSHAVQLMDRAGAEWVGQLCTALGEQYWFVFLFVLGFTSLHQYFSYFINTELIQVEERKS